MSSIASGIITLESLLAEHRSLRDSIVACRDVEGIQNTIRAIGRYLSVHGDGIRWFRMYSENPTWHQRSGLLNQELDKDIVLQVGPIVFYTLINPHSRKDLRVGTWHSRGKVVCNQFVMTKLYYTGDANRTKEDGITLLEFVPRMDQQPHVAICVLHRRDYRHLIRDLRQGTEPQNLLANQANQVTVPQQLGRVNLAPTAAGFMGGQQVSYTNIEIAGYGPTLENYAMNQSNSALPGNANVDMYNLMPGNNEAMNVGYHQSPQICNVNQLGSMHATTSLGKIGMSVRHDASLPNYGTNPSNAWPINNRMHDMAMNPRYDPYTKNPSNTLLANGSAHDMTSLENIGKSDRYPPDPSSNYVQYPSNTWPMNNGMHDMLQFTEQDAQVDQMARQSDSSATSFVNRMDAFMTGQNSMTSDNGPVLPTVFPPGAHLVTNEQNNNQDGYSVFPYFSGHNSSIEET